MAHLVLFDVGPGPWQAELAARGEREISIDLELDILGPRNTLKTTLVAMLVHRERQHAQQVRDPL
eukprot:scaffold24096_cov64-Phaeocystis_antarctica.AAC.19